MGLHEASQHYPSHRGREAGIHITNQPQEDGGGRSGSEPNRTAGRSIGGWDPLTYPSQVAMLERELSIPEQRKKDERILRCTGEFTEFRLRGDPSLRLQTPQQTIQDFPIHPCPLVLRFGVPDTIRVSENPKNGWDRPESGGGDTIDASAGLLERDLIKVC